MAVMSAGAADHSKYLPNPKLTPGDIDATLTKAVICNPNWSTETVRNVTAPELKIVYDNYGIAAPRPAKGYSFRAIVAPGRCAGRRP